LDHDRSFATPVGFAHSAFFFEHLAIDALLFAQQVECGLAQRMFHRHVRDQGFELAVSRPNAVQFTYLISGFHSNPFVEQVGSSVLLHPLSNGVVSFDVIGALSRPDRLEMPALEFADNLQFEGLTIPDIL
jgi:hypothetical protein